MLRQMMQQRPASLPSPTPTPTLVIGSGKGGVGKSIVATWTASILAHSGMRVLLLEGDQNLGNLHVLLGLEPVARLETLLQGDASPADLILPVHDNLWLLPGDSGAETLYGIGSVERARLHHRLTCLFDAYDVIIIDGAAGIESVVRVCAVSATRLIMVTVPEPAALTDAYAVTKIVTLQVPTLPVAVMVNRARDDGEGPKAFEKLQTAANRFLKTNLQYLGSLPEDPTVQDAIRAGHHLLDVPPTSRMAESLKQIITTEREALGLGRRTAFESGIAT